MPGSPKAKASASCTKAGCQAIFWQINAGGRSQACFRALQFNCSDKVPTGSGIYPQRFSARRLLDNLPLCTRQKLSPLENRAEMPIKCSYV
ncbi:Hypothetical predicted protein, partial [Pelobates cultripes]